MKRFFAVLCFSLWSTTAFAGVACTLPFTLVNGTTADASQVMANYNALVTCLSNAAAAGANADITSLSALTTPLAASEGGTTVYTGGTSTGSANAQVVATTTPTNFALTKNNQIVFTPGFSNTGATTLNVNGTGATTVKKQSVTGLIALAGNEILTGQIAVAVYDGTQYELLQPTAVLPYLLTLASLVNTDQTLTGGANVNSGANGNLGTPSGTLTVDCGKSPLQFATNGGAFTIAAPNNDGSCDLMFTNNASAGAITQSGFVSLTNGGDSPDLTNGHQYVAHIERINGTSFLVYKNLF